MRRLILVVLLVAVGCSDRERPRTSDDAGVARRVFAPPPGKVRAVPPYNIHAGGVGPYRLGAPLRDVLAMLPHGPRVELLQIENLVDYSLVRSDSDKLLIGASRAAVVEFVAVLAPDIARTAKGVEVGTTMSEADRLLGPRGRRPDSAADPALVTYQGVPGLRLLADRDRVAAILLVAERKDDERGDARGRCAGGRGETLDQVVAAAHLKDPTGAVVLPACLTADSGEALVVGGDEVVVVTGEAGKPRRQAGQTIADLSFAAPLDVDGDGHQEVVAVSRKNLADAIVVRVDVLSVEGGRLVARGGGEVYRLSSSSAAWVGATLHEVDLLVEVSGGAETVVASGLYLRRSGGVLRDVVPLSPVTLAVPRARAKRPSPAAGQTAMDAGVGDAAVAAAPPGSTAPSPRQAAPRPRSTAPSPAPSR